MPVRLSLRLPIILGVVMIVLLLALIVGWVLQTVLGALADAASAGVQWTLLSVGTTFFTVVLAGVVVYLILLVKTTNLNRRQSNFIDSVTHELKSPIASMKLCLQTLSRRQLDEQQQADFHRFMLEDLDRLDHLINQVLDAARVETPHRDADWEDVDLGALLEETAQAVTMSYRVPDSTVRLDVDPCRVRAHPLDLNLIFRNLIDNAVKYAAPEPRVEVTARVAQTGGVLVRVADNGPGIPHKDRRKVFGRFVRLGFELEREKPGTGLGLHIVRTLVGRLGGRVRICDGEPGSGAVFEVTLPSVPAPAGPAPPLDAAGADTPVYEP